MVLNIFHQNFNLSFHTTRKDNSDKCYQFEKLKSFLKHIEGKECARNIKYDFNTKDQNGKCQFIQYDFESVIYCPPVNAKAIFYKRRLSVYNLTIYDVTTRKAVNHMWHVSVAGRGSIEEVASCLFEFMKNSSVNAQECVLMFDTCGGKHRNAILATMCLYVVQVLNVPLINH
ncbi:hypothetical protein PR048_027024 [Dryococelus australis]|uniref:Uncharacterized protein n=1 Tax=Dryococelus australis TaxID=614101 RepID=A0ABQ9GMZ7_9NEOP|nr:hypothetical protein PR048_027024 [Dryococelus australis]